MSTRAERRLREAQTTLEQATQAHQSAAAAFSALEDRAVAGETVDPLELAGAQGDLGIKAKRLERAQALVEDERATVEGERARAHHRELVEGAEAARTDMDTTEALTAVEDLLRRAYAASDAWSAVRGRVLAEHGKLPLVGEVADGVDPIFSTFRLGGRSYSDVDVHGLVRDLKDGVQQAFNRVQAERRQGHTAA